MPLKRESHIRPGTNRGCLAPSVCFATLVGSKVEDASTSVHQGPQKDCCAQPACVFVRKTEGVAGGCEGASMCSPHCLMMAEQLFIFCPPCFTEGGRANRSQASFHLTLFEELAFARPGAQYSLLLNARSDVHAQTHAAQLQNTCSGLAPRVVLVLVQGTKLKLLLMLS